MVMIREPAPGQSAADGQTGDRQARSRQSHRGGVATADLESSAAAVAGFSSSGGATSSSSPSASTTHAPSNSDPRTSGSGTSTSAASRVRTWEQVRGVLHTQFSGPAVPGESSRQATPGESSRPETIGSTNVRRGHLWHLLALLIRCSRALVYDQPQVQYPPRFKAFAVVVLGFSLSWVGNYLIAVLPTMEDHKDTPCKYTDKQLMYSAKMLFVYFTWCAIARISLFLPCVAARVAAVQSQTHGFCRTYCIHLLIRDGPLYVFVVGSLLFWFHLMRSPNCEDRSPELYLVLKLYAIYSIMVSVLCLILAYWHNKLLMDFVRGLYVDTDERRAPPETVRQLPTVPYSESLFGDEETKPYPAECAICLGAWEQDDSIKVTPCSHAFHEECISNWLRSARTCALCRKDLTKLTTTSATTSALVIVHAPNRSTGAPPAPAPSPSANDTGSGSRARATRAPATDRRAPASTMVGAPALSQRS